MESSSQRGCLQFRSEWRDPHHMKPATTSITRGMVTPITIFDGVDRAFAEPFPMLILLLLLLTLPPLEVVWAGVAAVMSTKLENLSFTVRETRRKCLEDDRKYDSPVILHE